jgi:pimeloyl-ACP methyl ester carboxylesterase
MLFLFAVSVSANELTFCSYHVFQVPAPSLQDSMIKNDETQPLCVYLPADYETSGKSYGVVYYFPGFSCSADAEFIAPAVDELMKENPCILVSVTIRNSLGGSFTASNAVIGDWEEYVCKDVLGYVDSSFRTKADAKHRAICGHSMGGYAVIKLGFKHADLFGSVYSVDPGLFDAGGLVDAMPTWDEYYLKVFDSSEASNSEKDNTASVYENYFLRAYGAAMAPNPDKPYPYGDIPLFDGSEEDLRIQKLWYDGFGGWPALINEYLSKENRFDHLYIDTGVNDYYPWIPKGCMAFSRGLFDAKIPHNLVITEEGHWMNAEIFLSRVGEKTFSWVSGEE